MTKHKQNTCEWENNQAKSKHDIVFRTGIRLAPNITSKGNANEILHQLEHACGIENISADPLKNQHYRKGWRSGEGSALAVVFPQSLVQYWDILKVAVKNNLIIIMQAANTGLTEGSTPSGNNYDRHVLVINTLALNNLYLLNNGEQALSMPGVTLHKLEQTLSTINRAPHSVIGSSGLGATVVGGIANNSGGALVKRGPAYSELSVYAQIDEHGELVLVNHVGISLGHTADEVINNLADGAFNKESQDEGTRQASDKLYQDRIKEIDADTPSRFNADPRRLYQSSGCAGKLAVFAIRVDTHEIAKQEASFYIGTNNPEELYQLRRILLSGLDELPEVGEYTHRDIYDVAEKYGKDTFLSILHLGTKRMPTLFAVKGKVDALLNSKSWLPKYLSDKLLQKLSYLFPNHLPKRMAEYREKFEHYLVIKLSDNAINQGRDLLQAFFAKDDTRGEFFECNDDEAKRAYLHRFAAAGAAIRYQTIHSKDVGDILALDIALRRNEQQWLEQLPPELDQYIEKKLYYGHFFCHVFHQDYILKKGADAKHVKALMLKLLDERGAKYPAEHNVGHLYKAEDPLRNFYMHLDPTNTFNPGVGKMSKNQRNCNCCL